MGIVCPAPIEYDLCRDVLKLGDETEVAGRRVSSGTRVGARVVAVRAGPGKIQSAAATQLVADTYAPDVVVDVGGAGSLSSDLDVRDIVCTQRAYEYDVCSLDEFSILADDLTTTTLLCGLTEEGISVVRMFRDWVGGEKSARLVLGDIASGERNVDEASLREELHIRFGAAACTWETSAVLKTAGMNGVKALALRVITDHAGAEMSQELTANWRDSLLVLYSVLDELVAGGWLVRLLRCV